MLSIKHLTRNQHGMSIIETLVGLALLFVASVGSVTLFVHAMKFTGTAKHYTEATYAAKAQIEAIKSTDFEDITTVFPPYILENLNETSLPNGAMWFVTYPNGASADPLEILVMVFWPENGTTKYMYLTTEVVST